ncbi:hypothetical protein [Cerasicoccus maritimus]|uniref:hypothetical protein n=1 Tax=Cerasicoccus maritimus TaxID=490089 RepID=UPI0028529F54|nr:hypothetical protein [Cerasicoccus maritimus]
MKNNENESDTWARPRFKSLILDLSIPALNNAKIGDHISALQFLGKSDITENRIRLYAYKKFGLGIEVTDSRISEMTFHFISFVERLDDVFAPRSFTGKIAYKTKTLPHEKSAILELYGTSCCNWDDGMTSSLLYIYNGVITQFLFNSQNGKLKEIGLQAISQTVEL